MDYSRQKQTLFGEGKGNCFATCVACAFNIPLDGVPNFCVDYDEDKWWKEFLNWLRERGWTAIFFNGDRTIREDFLDGVLVIVGGTGPRGCDHAVLWKDGKMVHDPHILMKQVC